MNLDLHLSLQYIQVAKQNGRAVVIGKTGEKKEIEFAVDKVRKTDRAPRAINIQSSLLTLPQFAANPVTVRC